MKPVNNGFPTKWSLLALVREPTDWIYRQINKTDDGNQWVSFSTEREGNPLSCG